MIGDNDVLSQERDMESRLIALDEQNNYYNNKGSISDNEETDQDEVMAQSEMMPSNDSLDESDDDFDDLSSNC